MSRLQLNKSSLSREAKNLRTYQRFLPSLDLKRRQLMAERAKARKVVDKIKQDIETINTRVRREIPMLADTGIDLNGLVSVTQVNIAQENIVGTRLPRLNDMALAVRPYAFLAKPHWVDSLVTQLSARLEQQIELQIAERRVVLLESAVNMITQRVNLFEKVLIPEALSNIKKIRIYLSDEEMAAVVRSKMVKRKHAERHAYASDY